MTFLLFHIESVNVLITVEWNGHATHVQYGTCKYIVLVIFSEVFYIIYFFFYVCCWNTAVSPLLNNKENSLI